jgi:hypothetical protein
MVDYKQMMPVIWRERLSRTEMSHDLVVFVRINGMDPTAIRISPYTTIQGLEVYLPDCVTATFFLDGAELPRPFTLSFCGVTDHSVIDVITRDKDGPAQYPDKFLKKTQPPAPKVQDRLVDQFYNHVEGTTASYRKLVDRFLSLGPRPTKKKEHGKKTVIPEHTLTPATEALPRVW